MRGQKAVSPVVATLILILIAVAAAAALYLWLVNWQGSLTKGIGNPGAQATLTIGGSTSVYPFDQLAVTQFEQNETDVVVSDNQGGSGAGMLSVCNGAVDIGAASFPVTQSLLVSSYGCSAAVESTAQVTTVAYDAVDMIVPLSDPHGLLSINYDTVALIYADATAVTGGHPSLDAAPTTINNVTISSLNDIAAPLPVADAYNTTTHADNTNQVNVTAAAPLEWQDLPAAVIGAKVGSLTQAVASFAAPNVGFAEAACGGGVLANAQCYTPTATAGSPTTTPCGFLVCAGGTAEVYTVARSDASGTTQSFEARILDAGTSSGFASQSTLNSAGSAGFNGCGSSNYISDCGFVASYTDSGNPAVVSNVSSGKASIGYASDGVARAAGDVYLVPFTGVAQSAATDGAASNPTAWYGAILPTTGSSGTIAKGIMGPTTAADYYSGYLGWRPFDLVTLQAPTGVAASFLTFVLDPANNIALAGEAQEVSIYSV